MDPHEALQQADIHLQPVVDQGHNTTAQSASPSSVAGSVQELCAAYLATYNKDDQETIAARKVQGTAFALALLQHHFPEHEGFQIRSASLGKLVKFPINFRIKGEKGTDADYKPLVFKEIAEKDKRGKRKSKANIDKARKAEENRHNKHDDWAFNNAGWHQVDPKNIVGFEVWHKSEADTDLEGEEIDYQLLTYLILVLDNASILSEYVHMLNDVHWSDTLTMALTQPGKLEQGHGILVYGQLLEVYELVNGETDAEGDTFMKLSTGDIGSGASNLSVDLSKQSFDSLMLVLKVAKSLILVDNKQVNTGAVDKGQQDADTDAEGEVDDQIVATSAPPVTDSETQDLIMADA